jgi:hypothetical protein
MISMTENPEAWVREQAEAVVTQGQDVRKQVAGVVTAGADQFHLNKQGLLALSQSVMDGVKAALDKAVPQDPASVLRQVIDGVGDGLSSTALAARLAVEEAQAQQKNFADEDLSRMSTDLRTVGNQFVDIVSGTSKKFRSVTGAELSSLRHHAEQTVKRILPTINTTLAVMAKHPLQFGQESVEAGVRLSKQALGSLFAAVGHRMEEASKRLSGDGSVK